MPEPEPAPPRGRDACVRRASIIADEPLQIVETQYERATPGWLIVCRLVEKHEAGLDPRFFMRVRALRAGTIGLALTNDRRIGS